MSAAARMVASALRKSCSHSSRPEISFPVQAGEPDRCESARAYCGSSLMPSSPSAPCRNCRRKDDPLESGPGRLPTQRRPGLGTRGRQRPWDFRSCLRLIRPLVSDGLGRRAAIGMNEGRWLSGNMSSISSSRRRPGSSVGSPDRSGNNASNAGGLMSNPSTAVLAGVEMAHLRSDGDLNRRCPMHDALAHPSVSVRYLVCPWQVEAVFMPSMGHHGSSRARPGSHPAQPVPGMR
jgi:hypothetical protein